MDEEELEQPSSKINLGSFFERVDSVEKVANNALSRANANLGIISNQKLIINSLNVTIEAMETKIRDIANYIIIEKKLEKDVEEDRLLEEQDRLQKQAMVERATTIMGEPGPQGEPGQPVEQQKGSSLLGTLLRLGIGAFALKFIWPALLPLIKGSLGSAVGGGVRFFGGAVSKSLIGILGGIPIVGGAAKLIGSGIEKTSNKAGDGLESAIKNMGKDGKINIPTSTGEGSTEVEKENLVNGDESMRETLSEKDLMVTPGTRINEYGAEGGGEPSSGDLSMFDEDEGEEKKFKVTTGKKNKTLEDLKREYAAALAKIQKMKDEGRNVNIIEFEEDKAGQLKYIIGLKKAEMGLVSEEDKAIGKALKEAGMGEGKSSYSATTEYKFVEPIKSGTEELDLSSNNIDGDMTQAIAKTNERIDNLIGGENVEQNNGNLVSANKPNVTEAKLKLASAPLPFVKVIKNNQLSTSPKSYNGLPPEIAAMIS